MNSDFAHSDNTYFATWMRAYLQNGIGGEDIYNAQGSFPAYTFLNTPDTAVTNPNSYTNYGFAESSRSRIARTATATGSTSR